MKPKILIRPSDGERFVLCADGLYRIERMLLDFPDHIHHAWTYEVLVSHGFKTLNLIPS